MVLSGMFDRETHEVTGGCRNQVHNTYISRTSRPRKVRVTVRVYTWTA